MYERFKDWNDPWRWCTSCHHSTRNFMCVSFQIKEAECLSSRWSFSGWCCCWRWCSCPLLPEVSNTNAQSGDETLLQRFCSSPSHRWGGFVLGRAGLSSSTFSSTFSSFLSPGVWDGFIDVLCKRLTFPRRTCLALRDLLTVIQIRASLCSKHLLLF